jgi:hypothetical protein
VSDIEAIKLDSVLFYLVGQRAVFLALFGMCELKKGPQWLASIATVDAAIKASAGANWEDVCAYMIVEALRFFSDKTDGELFSRGLTIKESNDEVNSIASAEYFWAASLVRKEDPEQVDFSGVAAVRGARVISLITFLYWWHKVNKVETSAAFKKVKASPSTLNRPGF